jgi:hypothetical protein
MGGGWTSARMEGGTGMGYGSGSKVGRSGGAGIGPSLIGGRRIGRLNRLGGCQGARRPSM